MIVEKLSLSHSPKNKGPLLLSSVAPGLLLPSFLPSFLNYFQKLTRWSWQHRVPIETDKTSSSSDLCERDVCFKSTQGASHFPPLSLSQWPEVVFQHNKLLSSKSGAADYLLSTAWRAEAVCLVEKLWENATTVTPPHFPFHNDRK